MNKWSFVFFLSSVALFLIAAEAFAQPYYHIARPKLAFDLEYEYDEEERDGPFIDRTTSTSTFTEKVDIQTEGWIYHPALVEYEITLSPEWEQITENNTGEEKRDSRTFLQGYDAEFIFLQYKPYTLTLFTNQSMSTLSSNFSQKTKVETNDYGATLDLKYRVLPTVLGYTHYETDQTGFFESSTRKDELRLNMRNDTVLGTTRIDGNYVDVRDNTTFQTTNGLSRDISLQNIYDFHGRTSGSLSSFVEYRDKRSDFFSERGMDWYENLFLRHKKNFSTEYTIRYESFQLDEGDRREYQSFNAKAIHLLYDNLTTTIDLSASKNHNVNGQEGIYGAAATWQYVRTIPYGSIDAFVSQGYHVYDKTPNLQALRVNVDDEAVTLNASQLTILENQNIAASTIVVKEKSSQSLTTGIIYIDGADYDVVQLGATTFIARRAGSSIPDGATVFVDYQYLPEPPFDFGLYDSSYGVTLHLWDSLKLGYRYIRSSQHHLRGSENVSLRVHQVETAEAEYRWKWSTTTFEYTDVATTDIPSEEWRVVESLLFRPTAASYISMIFSTGEKRFTDIESGDNKETFFNSKIRSQILLAQNGILSLEAFYNESSGIVNDTEDTGVSSVFEWFYNIYSLSAEYTFTHEKDLTIGETFINHLFLVTAKRDLF